MPFTTPLIVREGPRGSWLIESPLVYHGRHESWTVPAGFKTDFASVPKILWPLIPPTGKYTKASVLHDYLYTVKRVPRRDADGLYRRAMREDRVGWVLRRIIWLGVRLGGWIAWRRQMRN